MRPPVARPGIIAVIAEADDGLPFSFRVFRPDGDGHALLNADRKTGSREYRLARPAVGCIFGDFSVAVHVFDPKPVERIEKMPAQNNERRLADPGMIRNKRHDAPAAVLGDALLGQAEKADVKIVEVEFFDPPFGDQPFLVRFDEPLLFLGADPGEGVVRRIAENNENGLLPLHLSRRVPLLQPLAPRVNQRVQPGIRKPVSYTHLTLPTTYSG